MAFPTTALQGCSISVSVFDGARQPMAAGAQVLFTIRDGNQQTVHRNYEDPQFTLSSLPFYNNFGDEYAVIAWVKGHIQAGFHPVKVAPNAPQQVDLMLLRKGAAPHFGGASW